MEESTKEAWTGVKNISPEAKEKRKKINKKIFKYGCLPIIIFFALMMIIGILMEDETTTEVTETSEEITEAAVSELSILENTDLFKSRFNQFCAETDFSYRINNLRVEPGEVKNTFTYMFSQHIGLVGVVNKSDEALASITAIYDRQEDAINFMLVMGATIYAINPELTPDDRGQILEDLGLMDENADLTNLSNNTIRNGVKYWINASDVTGIMFGAENAEIK